MGLMFRERERDLRLRDQRERYLVLGVQRVIQGVKYLETECDRYLGLGVYKERDIGVRGYNSIYMERENNG